VKKVIATSACINRARAPFNTLLKLSEAFVAITHD